MIIKDIVNYLNQRFPSELASDFDKEKIGLIVGDENIELKNILLTLDLTVEVVNEAIDNNVNFIIAHHPFIFNPLYKVYFQSNIGKILNLMFKHHISLYVAHTNLDATYNGVNDTLARILNINTKEVEVTKDNFLRYGDIKPMTLVELSEFVKEKFNLTGVRVAGSLDKIIKTVGIVGGAGDIELNQAIKLNLDCFITSEVKLHNVQTASSSNLSIIEVNHGVEKLVFNNLQKELIKNLNLDGKVFISEINTDPFISI